jgi:PiT family inorganic phosphate transporter
MILTLFIGVILLAFIFGLINGFIDGGGLVSTVIATRALEPMPALLLVACGEIAGVLLLGQAVARMFTHHLVTFPAGAPSLQILAVLFCAVSGALIWNTGMWLLALPSSSGHALVGGIVGALLSVYGSKGLDWPVFIRIFAFLGIVPIAGALASFIFCKLAYWSGEFLTPSAAKAVNGLQVFALTGMALVHGSNDGQKVLAIMLLASGAIGGSAAVRMMPWSLALACGFALALGTIFGSRRIIGTMAKRLYRIEPLQGFCAETSAMLLVGASSLLGYPMSMTHVMSTSVLGAGVAVHPRGVRWDLVADIALIWLMTIPAAGALSAALVFGARSVGARCLGGF